MCRTFCLPESNAALHKNFCVAIIAFFPISALEPAIYATTLGQGIKKCSLNTSKVTTMWRGYEDIDLGGLHLDTARSIMYWTSRYTIYRAAISQTEPETLLTTFKCEWQLERMYFCNERNPDGCAITADGSMNGLAYDWIAENLYVATHYGFILACNSGDARTIQEFSCRTLLTDQGKAVGIAVNPNEG